MSDPTNYEIFGSMKLDKKSKERLQAGRLRCFEQEKAYLSEYGELSSQHSRFMEEESDHRLPYRRDVDRIIHSKAYARYVDKTQVMYLVENDHISQRGLHVQLVSAFARGLAQFLRLNVDLVEAIALGHDVGHPPFGHEGEELLSELSQENDLGPFSHPCQSCRLLKCIEPLNLGLAVYDGFLCHDGGMTQRSYQPERNKSWEDHERDLQSRRDDPSMQLWPTTLEGCLVKLSDTISYLARDIEDAVRVGLIKREEIPETPLGRESSEILTALSRDLIYNSYGQDSINLSEEGFECLRVLREFNFKHIYNHPSIKQESPKVRRSYRIMFEHLLQDLKNNGTTSLPWQNFVGSKHTEYKESTSPAQIIVDYLSGMTDTYFLRTLERCIVPSRIHL